MTDTATMPEPSSLVRDIVDAQAAHIFRIIELVKAGASEDELDRAGAEVNARIRRELVEPNGEAGWAAAREAATRMRAGVRLLAESVGVDLDRDGTA